MMPPHHFTLGGGSHCSPGCCRRRPGPGFCRGHDWGALVAWWLCMFRPDRVKALVNMSVAFNPRNPNMKPLDGLRALYGDDYYICRFQVLGSGSPFLDFPVFFKKF